ncbi:alpha/beta fold hydrolase [Mycobacteroides chelonae]|jgi:pimeloyl-ACP methyl ester carboxylesterase|nr:alpha/beta hydrolase [Mycobacteroides chelonae]MBF9315259.1 alpha/beta hydrolase [Mycobacteroides chelonae]MBF9326623.1 alpha/beta hydrolase [Mycobacteroides chelonae]MBF9420800.1 alpha/beta hydrolase [Mycobacteroides chelonae]MBF9437009.1 alpha/beta hydrolase [Mycobacteroides chelonae]MBV6360702.1 alpha/beta hydrolase [Mycobacteroides chelonae]
MRKKLEADDRANTFVPHTRPEHAIDLGEVRMNHAIAGSPELPALLLIPAQGESWWGYENAIPLLEKTFQIFVVDLRGQGKSTWTPGRYTIDNYGNDLVRFIDLAIGRETLVAGNSSGGLLAAWLAAYAKPGQIRGAYLEDPPLFASELTPACGPGIKQGILGPLFASWAKWFGDQWSIGHWEDWRNTLPHELPDSLKPKAADILDFLGINNDDSDPPQHLKEYDPELCRMIIEGRFFSGCDHERLLSDIRNPILLSHHFRAIDPEHGLLVGAMADVQAQFAASLIAASGSPLVHKDFPDAEHAMHDADPHLYAETLIEWNSGL